MAGAWSGRVCPEKPVVSDENEDEYLDFAPSKHAVREAFAFCTVVGLVFGIIGWAIWYWAWRALEVWG